MARKKFEEVTQETQPQVPEAPPPRFVRKGGTAFRGDNRGRIGLYQPLFVPKGVAIRFTLAPTSLEGNQDFTEARMNGWEPCTPDQVTRDYEEAVRENIIALAVYEEGPDGYVRVGPHVLMWKPKAEWEEQYKEDIARAMHMASPGVHVMEDHEEELEAAVHFPE